jgi:hypothetical protein
MEEKGAGRTGTGEGGIAGRQLFLGRIGLGLVVLEFLEPWVDRPRGNIPARAIRVATREGAKSQQAERNHDKPEPTREKQIHDGFLARIAANRGS